MLSDFSLTQLLNKGLLRIGPSPAPKDIQPVSIDVHVGATALRWKPGLIDFIIEPDKDMSPYMESYTIPSKEDGGLLVAPYGFLLFEIHEYIELDDNHAALLHGVSSIGRLGPFIQNAGLVDPLWKGRLTGELFNAAPYYIKIWKGLRIGQITFEETSTRVHRGYGTYGRNSKYQYDMTVSPSRAFKSEQD